jgi:hypothetical protein
VPTIPKGALSRTVGALGWWNNHSSSPDVAFDPPAIELGYPCPYQVKLTVTSSVSELSAEKTMIYVKISGDVNGDGLVNPTDKLLLRKSLGWEGDPGTNPADLDCNGLVNPSLLSALARSLCL